MTAQLTSELLAAIVVFTDQPECELVKLVLSTPLFPFMLRHLNSTYPDFIRTALWWAGELSLRTDPAFTTALLEADFLDKLSPLLSSLDADIRRTAYRVLSNIVAGTRDQVQTVMTHAVMMKLPFGLIDQSDDVVLEVSYVLCNISYSAYNSSLLDYIRTQPHLLEHLGQALGGRNTTILEKLLNFISILIRKAKEEAQGQPHIVLQLFLDKGCFEALKRLACSHTTMTVSQKAYDLLSELDKDQGQPELTEFISQFNFS